MHKKVGDGDHHAQKEWPRQGAGQDVAVDDKGPQHDRQDKGARRGRCGGIITQGIAPEIEWQRNQAE